ncbi:transglutaminase-like domain-containing protein [Nakamurella leprariae]|uniref:Transglutaminase family protein n=1 Tax=Nakamurella leprariae TaxID=2803911 RepID=A0A938YEE4_9ACTN|nr:transglutaminase family protein [Nakamurella leprariae]MBM9466340.1 transglutaminase family protein [Nakamurella leprariae]
MTAAPSDPVLTHDPSGSAAPSHDTPVTSRSVTAGLAFDVVEPGTVVLQIAVAQLPGWQVDDALTVELDGTAVPVTEIIGTTGARLHVLRPGVGPVTVHYEATVTGRADPTPVVEADLITYRRPSRYAESDKLAAVAQREFGSLTGAPLLAAVSSWVGQHLSYVSGSSDPIDGAVDTYLLGAGVCRDYAHLVVALLRARDVPARLVAVYAPGLDPMDFHAVAEAYVDGAWHVVDGTLLAPRSALVRIATGRDAADTAFLDDFGGSVDFHSATVTAVVNGTLPNDDPRRLVELG